MKQERLSGLDIRTRAALEDLRLRIRERYPTATFDVSHDPDEPVNVLLTTTVDVDDPDDVLDLVMDRLLELQVEERIPVYVIPVRTPERILAAIKETASKPRGGPIPSVLGAHLGSESDPA